MTTRADRTLWTAGPSRSGLKVPLAPGTTTIVFCPVASMVMSATPLETASSAATSVTSAPAACSESRSQRPWLSAPTWPIIATRPPSRAEAAAWLPPLPPGYTSKRWPISVSPGHGNRGTCTTRSALRLPTTTIDADAAIITLPAMPALPPHVGGGGNHDDRAGRQPPRRLLHAHLRQPRAKHRHHHRADRRRQHRPAPA
jgi:hypothetical protein